MKQRNVRSLRLRRHFRREVGKGRHAPAYRLCHKHSGMTYEYYLYPSRLMCPCWACQPLPLVLAA